MNSYTLFELNEFVRQVIALNFNDAIWLTAEIAQLDWSKGHCYLSLVQKEAESDTIVAQSSAMIWARQAKKIKRQLGTNFHQILQEGVEVKLQIRVDFHERYGLKLIVEAIDLQYTLGQFALQRQQTIEQLQAQNLLQKNEQIPLPIVCQRIAIISSETAAGLQDFLQQLVQNPFGYQYQNILFPAAVQGQKVVANVLQQLQAIELRQKEFDCVVIIRGGGSKLDLAAFDQFELCEAVANYSLPVLSGIGHEVDESVLDLVVHKALKTPTAVAEFLIQRNAQFEGQLEYLFQVIRTASQQRFFEEKQHLENLSHQVQLLSKQSLQKDKQKLSLLELQLHSNTHNKINQEKTKLQHFEAIQTLLSLDATLKRGFSVLYKNGKPVDAIEQLNLGDVIENHFLHHTIESKIEKIKK